MIHHFVFLFESLDLRSTVHTPHLLRVKFDWLFCQNVLGHPGPVVHSTTYVLVWVMILIRHAPLLNDLIDALLCTIVQSPLGKALVAFATFASLREHLVVVILEFSAQD